MLSQYINKKEEFRSKGLMGVVCGEVSEWAGKLLVKIFSLR